MFRTQVLIVRRPKLYYRVSGIITPIGGRPVHRLRASPLYKPPDYSIGRHVFLSGILSVLSGGTVNLLTHVTMNIIFIISRC